MGEKDDQDGKGCLSGHSETVLNQQTFKELFESYEVMISRVFIQANKNEKTLRAWVCHVKKLSTPKDRVLFLFFSICD